MSHTPEHAASVERTQSYADNGSRAEAVTEGTSLGLNLVLFTVLFLAFIAGLYVMSLMTPLTFLLGLGLCLVSLFITFTVIPKALT